MKRKHIENYILLALVVFLLVLIGICGYKESVEDVDYIKKKNIIKEYERVPTESKSPNGKWQRDFVVIEENNDVKSKTKS